MTNLSLQLADEFVPPDYRGHTIANVPATIARLFDVPFVGLPPLHHHLWQPLGTARRVVLLVVDALGWNLFQKERATLAPWLPDTQVMGQLSSIFPSTTVAALTSLWTGLAPAQHGMLGLNLFMPEYALTMQTLRFTPAFDKYPDALIKAGLEPETFLHGPGFAQQLAAAAVPTFSFKGQEIVESALSKMHDRGAAGQFGALSLAHMFAQMRQLLEERSGESLYVNAYWPSIDSLTHLYGWDHAVVADELAAIFWQLQHLLLTPLSAAARKDTIFLLVADHGQVHTPAAQQIYLEDHPELWQMLFMVPAGEPRTPYLYVKNGRQTAVLNYLHTHFNHAMQAIPSELALASGLLGPQPHAPQAAQRIGDVLVTMRQGYLLLTHKEKKSAKIFHSRHGGMTSAEMLVPWLGFRLDT